MGVTGNDPTKVGWSQVDNSVPMNNDPTMIPTESQAYNGDLQTLASANAYTDTKARKAWVSGVLKPGAFIYSSKATTSSGSAVFYITDNGLSSGNAVFNNVYADSISIVVYGNSASYQPFTPTVSADKKSITISVNQVTNISVLSLLFVAASNGVDVRLWVMGD